MARAKPLTKREGETLHRLKKRLAEQGYYIFTLAKRLRKGPGEFIAANKNRPQEFVIVRAKEKGVITVQPFRHKSTYPKVDAIIREMQEKEFKNVYWRKQIDPRRSFAGIENFISPSSERRLKLVTDY